MISDYRRNYPDMASARLPDCGMTFGFDAVAEVIFANDAAYAAFLETMKDPAIVADIREDEARFCDPARVMRFTSMSNHKHHAGAVLDGDGRNAMPAYLIFIRESVKDAEALQEYRRNALEPLCSAGCSRWPNPMMLRIPK